MKPSKKMYTAKEMDRVIKINMRLLEKFREPLLEEYGSTVSDVLKMMDMLYQEQNSKMPAMWYEYGFGGEIAGGVKCEKLTRALTGILKANRIMSFASRSTPRQEKRWSYIRRYTATVLFMCVLMRCLQAR